MRQRILTIALASVCSLAWAQTDIQFTAIQTLTNNEIGFVLSAASGSVYRVDSAADMTQWCPLVALAGADAPVQHTDSAAPYAAARFYRAAKASTNTIAGDYLRTSDGDVIFQPRNHATFVASWHGKTIYVDPTTATSYTGIPKADLILVSHTHSDHFSTTAIDSVRGTNCLILGPQAVSNSLTAAQKAIARVLNYGDSTNVLGLTVQAVHAYNPTYHPLGTCEGFVLTIGDKRIYISADTSDVPELHALANIDVAFIAMNQPYTLTVAEATNLVRTIQPRVVYPYHYRGSATNPAAFKEQLGTDLGIEVRLRQWY